KPGEKKVEDPPPGGPPAVAQVTPADPRSTEELLAPVPPGARPILVLDPAGHTAAPRRVLFTPDAQQVISVGSDKTVRVWDVASGDVVRTIHLPAGPGDEGSLYAGALSPD